jgi:hypothetical protein
MSVRVRYSRPYFSMIDFSTTPPSTLRYLCGPLPYNRQGFVLQPGLGFNRTQSTRYLSLHRAMDIKLVEKTGTMGNGYDIRNYEISDSGQGQVTCFCEHNTIPSGSVICGEFSWLAEQLLASQEGLCCMELVLVVVINFGLGARFTHLSCRQFHCVHTRQYEVLHGTVRCSKADWQLGILCTVTVHLHLSVGRTRRSRRIDRERCTLPSPRS